MGFALEFLHAGQRPFDIISQEGMRHENPYARAHFHILCFGLQSVSGYAGCYIHFYLFACAICDANCRRYKYRPAFVARCHAAGVVCAASATGNCRRT
jgi:hypothetical protein